LESFNPPEPETNLPKLQIFAGAAPVLVEAIKACSYDKKKVEDIEEFSGDDPIDALRYIVDAAENYFDDANQEFRRIQAQEALINKLNTSNDWTAFYRNSAKLEADDVETKPVGRYHSRR
jgi:hypothetical protein